MKKIISVFAAAAVLATLSVGCGSEEAPDELDLLIDQLQTTHLNTSSPEDSAESEEVNPYKSLTGTVISFTETDITVKSDGKELKFIINEETQILGGTPSAANAVTVTYCEPEKKSKGTVANVITIVGSSNKNEEITSDASLSDSVIPQDADSSSAEASSDTFTEKETVTQTETQTDVQTETQTNAQTETQTDTQTETQINAQTEI